MVILTTVTPLFLTILSAVFLHGFVFLTFRLYFADVAFDFGQFRLFLSLFATVN